MLVDAFANFEIQLQRIFAGMVGDAFYTCH